MNRSLSPDHPIFCAPRPPPQILGEIAFRLALQARVRCSQEPALCDAIILELSVLYRQMIAVIDVIQDNPLAGVHRHGQPDRVGAALGRHARTPASVAEIAAIAQSIVIGDSLIFFPGGAGAPGMG